jgi:hypothetical protein
VEVYVVKNGLVVATDHREVLSGDRLFCRERRNGGVPAGCSSSASTLDARTLPDLATLDATRDILGIFGVESRFNPPNAFRLAP